MLIEFSVANYRSFKNRVTFSMVAAPIKSKDKSLDENNVFEVRPRLNLLTSAAIYGANASGKSNFVSAMRFMREFVLSSTEETRARGRINLDPFRLSAETSGKPSRLEIVFMAAGVQYRYGFEADRERVHREWLYHVPTIREARLFEREGDEVRLSEAFREGKGLAEKTRPNALFLSVVAQFNGRTAKIIANWFLDLEVISGLDDRWLRFMTESLFSDPQRLAEVTYFIKTLDLSIDDLRLELDQQAINRFRSEFPDLFQAGEERKFPGLYQIKTAHRTYNMIGQPSDTVFLDLDEHESEGTRKLFALAGPLLSTLGFGSVMIADEFDARLHPLITRRLVEAFNSHESNPLHAQLVFTTQDTNLLDNSLLRRDQIWFAEKDNYGATDLYSLAEYKGVRNDASYEKDYIRGRYGAIPYLGDLTAVLEGADGEAA
jgi:hypothetical protein